MTTVSAHPNIKADLQQLHVGLSSPLADMAALWSASTETEGKGASRTARGQLTLTLHQENYKASHLQWLMFLIQKARALGRQLSWQKPASKGLCLLCQETGPRTWNCPGWSKDSWVGGSHSVEPKLEKVLHSVQLPR